MALVPYTVVALAESDADGTNGKNIVEGATVILKNTNDVAVNMYDDSLGANPQTAKFTGSNGTVVIYAEPGEYTLEVNTTPTKISLGLDSAVKPYPTISDAINDPYLNEGDTVKTQGRETPGDGGHGDYIVVAGGTGIDDGGSYIDTTNGLQLKLITGGKLSIKVWGARTEQESPGFDSYQAITNALAAHLDLYIPENSTFNVSQEILIKRNGQSLKGVNTSSIIRWIGATPATPPDKEGGTSVVCIAPTNVATGALLKAQVESFNVDMNETPNLVGISCVRATSQTLLRNIKVYGVGVNSMGWYFSKEWYAEVSQCQSKSNEAATPPAGSIGAYYSASVDQINGCDFDIQSLIVDIGHVMDTSDTYFYLMKMKGYAEKCRIGLKHIAGFGVRTAFMQMYFENNSEADIDWGDDVAGADTSQQITWASCSFNVGSIVKIAEGTHYFLGCDRITEIQCSGGEVYVDGNSPVNKVETGQGRITHKVLPSYTLAQGRYVNPRTPLRAGTALYTSMPSGVASHTFDLPDDFYNEGAPEGAVIKFRIAGRRNFDAGVSRITEGYLVKNNVGNWGITILSENSNFEWTVTANASGGIDLQYDDTGGVKYVVCEFMPM